MEECSTELSVHREQHCQCLVTFNLGIIIILYQYWSNKLLHMHIHTENCVALLHVPSLAVRLHDP